MNQTPRPDLGRQIGEGDLPLFLLFDLGSDQYALDVERVVDVLPLVRIQAIPQGPVEVAGVFRYRGQPVPVVDLSQITMGRPSAVRFSTRIILVHYPSIGGEQHLLGLIAERVTRTLRRRRTDFVASGVRNDRAPHLGPVATDPDGMVQLVSVGKLLPRATQQLLFRDR